MVFGLEQYLQFISHNFLLCLAFVGVLVLIIVLEFKDKLNGAASINPQELVAKMNHDQAMVLDLRSQDAFRKGHILGAMNLSQQDIEKKPGKVEKYKEKPLVLVCNLGQQSPKVANELKKKGFSQVYSLKGGIQAWQNAELPLSSESK